MPTFHTALVWFRRDLRNFDHAALYHALKQSRRVFCVFIFDPVMQSEKSDPERRFIRRYLPQLARLHSKQIHAPRQLGTVELAGITLGINYPAPIVPHDAARKCTLERYAVVKKTV